MLLFFCVGDSDKLLFLHLWNMCYFGIKFMFYPILFLIVSFVTAGTCLQLITDLKEIQSKS
jgi:hypothetical protein